MQQVLFLTILLNFCIAHDLGPFGVFSQPQCSAALTFKPPEPLPPLCAGGLDFKSGYCNSNFPNVKQSPINVDTTNFVKAEFSSELTLENSMNKAFGCTVLHTNGNGKFWFIVKKCLSLFFVF